jgi:hypothetical protein
MYNPFFCAFGLVFDELTSDRAFQYYQECSERFFGFGIWVIGNYAIAVYELGRYCGSLYFSDVVEVELCVEPLLLMGAMPQKKRTGRTRPAAPLDGAGRKNPTERRPDSEPAAELNGPWPDDANLLSAQSNELLSNPMTGALGQKNKLTNGTRGANRNKKTRTSNAHDKKPKKLNNTNIVL